MNQITDEQWAFYEEHGYLRLGAVLTPERLAALQTRIDEIMLGTAEIDYNQLLMQLDSATGKYEDAGVQSLGFKGATRAYRKIQELEIDPLFRAYVEDPLFAEICTHVYGPSTPVASFRAMFMNKPANQGACLPWHQDRWSHLDRDPLITVWTALDPATRANGCVHIIDGSHKFGLINPQHGSGFVSTEQADDLLKKHPVEFVELAPGEAILLHNWLLHASEYRTDHLLDRMRSLEDVSQPRRGDFQPENLVLRRPPQIGVDNDDPIALHHHGVRHSQIGECDRLAFGGN